MLEIIRLIVFSEKWRLKGHKPFYSAPYLANLLYKSLFTIEESHLKAGNSSSKTFDIVQPASFPLYYRRVHIHR